MEVRAHPTLPLYHISSDSWETNTLGTDHTEAAWGCFTHPTPQISITLWSPWDHQLPGASHAHSSVTSGSSVVPPVVPVTNPHSTSAGVHRGKVYDQHPPSSAHKCLLSLLPWENLFAEMELYRSSWPPLALANDGDRGLALPEAPCGRPGSLAGGVQGSGLMKEISRRMFWGTLLHFRTISRCETPTTRQPSYQQGPESP